MKRIISLTLCLALMLSVCLTLFACKGKVEEISGNYNIENAQPVDGLTASAIFFEAVANTEALENYYKKVELTFSTDVVGGQNQHSIAELYIVGNKYFHSEAVLGRGSKAEGNTGANLFYYDGIKAFENKASGKNLTVDVENPDFATLLQANGKYEYTDDIEAKIADLRSIFSYDFVTEKLSDATNEQVLSDGRYYYMTVTMDMDIGTKNSSIQAAVNKAVENGTGANAGSVIWENDSVLNVMLIQKDGQYLLHYVELWESYTATQIILKAKCTQMNAYTSRMKIL